MPSAEYRLSWRTAFVAGMVLAAVLPSSQRLATECACSRAGRSPPSIMTRLDACTAVCSHEDAYGRQRIQKRLLASVLQVASAKLLFFWHLAGLADQRPSTEIKVLRGLAAAILGRPGASRDRFGSGAEQQYPA